MDDELRKQLTPICEEVGAKLLSLLEPSGFMPGASMKAGQLQPCPYDTQEKVLPSIHSWRRKNHSLIFPDRKSPAKIATGINRAANTMGEVCMISCSSRASNTIWASSVR